jgi:hypothetical protein
MTALEVCIRLCRRVGIVEIELEGFLWSHWLVMVLLGGYMLLLTDREGCSSRMSEPRPEGEGVRSD